jgi:hypothetical protein
LPALFVTEIARVPASENFFKDFAAHLMFVVGLPLFLIAEPIVGEHTRTMVLVSVAGVAAATGSNGFASRRDRRSGLHQRCPNQIRSGHCRVRNQQHRINGRLRDRRGAPSWSLYTV